MKRLPYWLLVARLAVVAGTAHGQAPPDTLRHANWQLYWANEFNTPGDSSVVAARWQFAYPWGRNLGGSEGQYYTGEQVAVDSAGLLHLRARLRDTPRPYRARQLRYDSGMLFSRSGKDSLALVGCDNSRTGFTYGLFEIRCRLPRADASTSAFWLYGAPDEVDVFEAGGQEEITNNIILWNHEFWRLGQPGIANEASQSFFHWTGPGRLTDSLHTYAVSWQPQELVYYFDGVAIRHETRLLPLGCPLDVISNLGMYSWAQTRTASLDIDYIRVYKQPKGTVARPPVAPVAPAPGILQFPHTTAGVLGAEPPEMRWRWQEHPNQRPRLELVYNRNPHDFASLPLPVRGRWLAPLVAFNDADSPRHRVASPDSGRSSLSWTLYDLCGQPVRSGQQLPAVAWELSWPALPPGAYSLRLRAGTHQVRQTVYQLGRPDATVFTPEWLAGPPAPAETDAAGSTPAR
ncbi:glycoside hydrolase family 16 protein [Hymenobacter negativus]|uniref:Glycoside hydrolase family 16 protein n=1 Tax=Hymenobacter negativus TaxID=2795026 RepID=A0ABS0Q982_9BACT|nr:glycoside hydrolase family 16 protein [Hymenobacter negativus]MBH8558776.1 glycoside hydrolase family 16 protein [Hymenobacter negativus]